jgi:hypothetical protein
MDNTGPHNSGGAQRCIEASIAERLPHPTQSPDLTASDSFLFGYIKERLSDYNRESREDLLNAMTDNSTGFGQEGLLNVSESWVNRPKWVIEPAGKHYTN